MSYRISPTTVGRIIKETCNVHWNVLKIEGFLDAPAQCFHRVGAEFPFSGPRFSLDFLESDWTIFKIYSEFPSHDFSTDPKDWNLPLNHKLLKNPFPQSNKHPTKSLF